MKNSLRRRIGGEEGKVLVLVLVMLVVGGLVLAPLLGLGSTGLAAGRVYERKASELYAADAGVEDAIWKLQNPDVSQLPHQTCADKTWSENYTMPEINGKNVVVTIEYLSGGIFRITSTASENGSTTTVLSYVQGDYLEYDTWVSDGGTYTGTITDQTVYGAGDLTVAGSIEGDAVVYVEGDLEVAGNIENGAYVYVKGNLELTGFGNIEDTAIVCVGGNLTLGHCSEDGVEIYVLGNLVAQKIENESKVCVEGTVTVTHVEDYPIVCGGGEVTVGNLEGGYIYAPEFTNVSLYPPDCPMCCVECSVCCQCPLVFGKTERAVTNVEWTGWRVTTYLINP